jgi:hypothetical protein
LTKLIELDEKMKNLYSKEIKDVEDNERIQNEKEKNMFKGRLFK